LRTKKIDAIDDVTETNNQYKDDLFWTKISLNTSFKIGVFIINCNQTNNGASTLQKVQK